MARYGLTGGKGVKGYPFRFACPGNNLLQNHKTSVSGLNSTILTERFYDKMGLKSRRFILDQLGVSCTHFARGKANAIKLIALKSIAKAPVP